MNLKRPYKLYQVGLHYPKTVLGLAIVFTLLSLFFAKGLRIETSLTALAPKNSESVKGDHAFKNAFGSSNYLLVTVEGTDPESVARFADALSDKAERLSEIDYVDYKRPVDYFKKKQWLYLDLKDLQEIRHRVERTASLEKKGVSLAFRDLMDFSDEEDRPDLNFDDIIQKYRSSPWALKKFDTDEAGNLILLRMKVKNEVANVDGARKLVGEMKGIVSKLKEGSDDYRAIEVGYAGSLETMIEESDQIKHEMALVSAAVLGVLVLLVFLYFKKAEAVLLVGFPMVAGVIWAGGIIYLLLGHLNLMSSFAGGILAGLGSDYGIYLLTRYYIERSSGKDFQIACQLAFEKTGTATYASMITTLGAFVALLFSRFGVFFEFGLLGAIGVVLNYVAMVVVLPSMLVMLERRRQRTGRKENVEFSRGEFSAFQQRIFTKRPVFVTVAVVALVALAGMALPSGSRIHFEQDMMVNKKLPVNELYKKMEKVKGSPLSPTGLLVSGKEEMEKAVQVLDRLVREDSSHQLVFDNVIGVSAFVPNHVSEKQPILAETAREVRGLRWLPQKEKEDLASSLEDSAHAEPVSLETLPQEVKRVFVSPYQKGIFAIFLFPAFDRLTSESLHRYHDGIRHLIEATGFHFTASDVTFVYDDIVRLIEREAPRGMILICLFLAGVSYVLSRSVVRTLITMGNLLAGLVLLSGCLWLAGIPLNVMNIAAIPVILGTGIDSFIHFAQRYDESGEMRVALKEKIPAIIFSNLTTIIGFAGFLLVSNPGIRSVGWVAVLGLILVTLLSTLVFPRCLILEGAAKTEERQDDRYSPLQTKVFGQRGG